MGHELIYRPGEHHVGSVSIRRWNEIGKLLPLLVEFLNSAMHQTWTPGVMRDVRVFEGGMTEPKTPPPERPQPVAEPFSLERMLSQELLGVNEVIIFEAEEWDRLFAWCDFLSERDGAYALYRPLVELLRPNFAGIFRRRRGGLA